MAAVPTNTHEKAHIMLSYCDCDQLVTHVYQYLKEKLQVPIWLDKFDGKNASVTSSISTAIEGSRAVVCFLTPAYQNTLQCKQQLMYAAGLNKPIIPCIVGSDEPVDNSDDDDNDQLNQPWFPTDWLGLVVSDLPQVSFEGVDEHNVDFKCEELLQKIRNIVGDKPAK